MAPGFDFRRALVGLVYLLLVVPLVVYAYVGLSSRFVADDFCTAGTLASQGFLGSQLYWYTDWSGRFSFTAVINLLEMVGPSVVRVLPAAFALATIAATAWTLKEAMELRGAKPAWEPTLLAMACFGLAYVIAPDLYQSFYWQTGLVTYLLPVVLLVVQAGLILRAARLPERTGIDVLPALIGFVAFVGGGLAEVTLAIQAASYAAVTIWVLLPGGHPSKPRVRSAILAGLVGTMVSAALVLLAPGNQARMAFMPDGGGLGSLVVALPRYTAAFIVKSFLGSPLGFLGGMAFGAGLSMLLSLREGLGDLPTVRPWRRTALLAFVVGGLIFVSMIPPAVATAAYPVDRSLLPGTFLLVGGSLALGWLLGEAGVGHRRGRRFLAGAWTLSVLGALVIGISSLLTSGSIVSDAQGYADAWDRRQDRVRESIAASVTDVAVRPMPHIGGLAELEDDPEYWLNACFASYYGLDTVQAR